MSVSSVCPELVQYLARAYGLGREVSCIALPGGVLNSVFLLRASGREYVLKKHQFRNSYEKLREVLLVLGHLESYGFPADFVEVSESGLAAFSFCGDLYSLHRRLEGQYVSSSSQLNRQQLKSCASTLVDYHRAVWCLSEGGGGRGGSLLPLQFSLDFMPARELIKSCCVRFDSGGALRAALAAVDQLEVSLDRSLVRSLPQLYIHGDYRLPNMVFDGNNVSGVFDWDLVQYAPRLLDVCGELLVKLACTQQRGDGGSDAAMNLFLRSYHRTGVKWGLGLGEEEIALIPAFVVECIIRRWVVSALCFDTMVVSGEIDEADRREVCRPHRN